MKYILMDQIKAGDLFTFEFDDKDDAIKEADRAWHHLSDYDKNRRESFYVLESVNSDEEAENHYDGDIVKTWHTIEELRDYLLNLNITPAAENFIQTADDSVIKELFDYDEIEDEGNHGNGKALFVESIIDSYKAI